MRRTELKKLLTTGIVAVSMIMLSACKSSNSSSPGQSLSMMVDFTAAKAASDTVILSSAKVLIKEIEFENDALEDSAELEIGPFLVNLNLAGGLTEIATGDLPNGTYDKIKFEIHKAEDDGETHGDTAFYNGPADDERFSFIISGTYNDTAFTYKSQKGVEQESDLNPPIVISDSLKDVNVTLIVNPSGWFKKNGNFLDPRNEANRSDIDDNIKNSFRKAVEDDDHDGHED